MIFTDDLTWILLLPVLGAVAAIAAPVRYARWLALLFSAATFALSMAIFFRMVANGNFGDLNHPADFTPQITWIDFTAKNVHFKIDYFLGVDGLSIPLVILNALLTMLAIIGGWEKMRVKEYMALLLLLETGVMGVFISLDLLLFLLIFLAFAIKIPMFPFHTWLPDAHTDAPTEVSVILAGVLLKMGAYGLIRICLTLLPGGVQEFAPWLAVLAAINIIYGAGICLVQTDMKKLIAYSSVSHMGVILLGVAAAAAGFGGMAFRQAALTGATIQMFSHGLITGMLFFCVGVIYDHAHT